MTVENFLRYPYLVSLVLFGLLMGAAIYMYYSNPTNDKLQTDVYEFTTLDIPPGSFGTRALGVNDQGDIVGTNGPKGFVIRNGTTSAIHKEGSAFDQVSAINSSGIIAGTFSDAGQSRAFIHDSKTYVMIEPPAVTYAQAPQFGSSSANAINELGHVVGIYNDERGTHGFFYDGNKHVELNYPGATQTQTTGINVRGQIVGFHRAHKGRIHGFVYDGKYSTLDFPGGPESNTRLMGINDLGEIVGVCSCGPYKAARGFLYRNGQFIDIQFPNASETFPNGINDYGMIVGFYNGSDGGHGFYAVPKNNRK